MNEHSEDSSRYSYLEAEASHTQAYMWSTVDRELAAFGTKRAFDLGCGNGAYAAALSRRGIEVAGVDPSEDRIRIANQAHPDLALRLGSADDPLAERFGQFPAVVSLYVVEYVFFPRKYAKCVFDLLESGGIALISTPYHGYLKNLTGKLDGQFTALWDYGYIKFWLIRTLTALLQEAGLEVLRFHRVGRIPLLAKSMIAIAWRPA